MFVTHFYIFITEGINLETQELSYQVSGKISKPTYVKIKQLIDAGMFLNFSDYTRKAVEDKLEKLGETEIISIKETSVQEAKKTIEEYLNQHQGPVYPSNIADHYGLELEPVFEAIR
jgi:Arc/MetJ-type ribon-helix-helix transcriptional regulator